MTTTPEWVYKHAEELHNHWWWRPGWQAGTRFYAWHITFDNQAELHELAESYQNELSKVPGLDIIPQRWLHLTMQGIGFVEDVPLPKIAEIAHAARTLLSEIEPVHVQFQRPVIRPEAIALVPMPFEPIQQLRTIVREAIGAVMSSHAIPDRADGFQPHISLAYVSSEQPASEVLRAIERVEAKAAKVAIPAVSLIEMHRDRRMYEWRTLDVVRIAS